MLDKYLGNTNKSYSKAHKYITKVLLSIIILFSCLIICDLSAPGKAFIKKHVFEETFDFMEFKNIYNFLAGKKEEKQDESKYALKSFINYKSKEKYLNGEKYFTNAGEVLCALESGIVIFTGEKESLGPTIIIQGSNGFDFWYSGVEDINPKLYDFIKKDDIVGVLKEEFILQIVKDDKYYTYEEYLNEI